MHYCSTRSPYPLFKLAAVLVVLFEDAGELRVLLTTRSKTLRTHAGQTALPGGRYDTVDKNLVDTAYREAFEEVALPLYCPDLYTICLMPPRISLHGLIVTPVVALLTDPAVLQRLVPSADEVAHIFTHPLRALLDPSLINREAMVPRDSENWFYPEEYHNFTDASVDVLGGSMYRNHRFRSTASPVKGLTSDILIQCAEVAFQESTLYERYAPGQYRDFFQVMNALKHSS
ncbi:hypothetical protein FISHEDRAFT_32643 [Fistulina hepatica ATCC 64428]|uniref:Nudix hydrolase domain-containing protein n=1 Tax=Fistulina hepatica ATCC 64428 TaxID=1128425 RepID=A0A0D7AR28_9AGAR|nr:hypothetical protein FISHEDRAFT_32643 [Fistulina hepatica ATCC 64428]